MEASIENVNTIVNLAAIAGVLAVVVSPNVINLLKDWGFSWPNWLKVASSVIGGLIVAFVAVVAEGGWSVVDLTDWQGFWLPFLVVLIPSWVAQQVAWYNFWKTTRVGEAIASFGSGHP